MRPHICSKIARDAFGRYGLGFSDSGSADFPNPPRPLAAASLWTERCLTKQRLERPFVTEGRLTQRTTLAPSLTFGVPSA
ncbi:hypothetical protein BDI4_1010042 [Burkholderia diffusa]|nr:hypothetical protein BDI4_1010042 [Burkholderia diffusa]